MKKKQQSVLSATAILFDKEIGPSEEVRDLQRRVAFLERTVKNLCRVLSPENFHTMVLSKKP